MIATGVITPFLIPMKIALLAAFLAVLPYVLYQAWAFVAPGLYAHEKQLVLPLIVSSTLLFFVGHGVLLLLRVRRGVRVHQQVRARRASRSRPTSRRTSTS